MSGFDTGASSRSREPLRDECVEPRFQCPCVEPVTTEDRGRDEASTACSAVDVDRPMGWDLCLPFNDRFARSKATERHKDRVSQVPLFPLGPLPNVEHHCASRLDCSPDVCEWFTAVPHTDDSCNRPDYQFVHCGLRDSDETSQVGRPSTHAPANHAGHDPSIPTVATVDLGSHEHGRRSWVTRPLKQSERKRVRAFAA